MKSGEAADLADAIERLHGCRSTFRESVPVVETFRGETVWRGIVDVFDLEGHPTASRCYAWSAPIEGSERRRFYAVLHQPPVDSPLTAVRAAIVSEAREQKVTDK